MKFDQHFEVSEARQPSLLTCTLRDISNRFHPNIHSFTHSLIAVHFNNALLNHKVQVHSTFRINEELATKTIEELCALQTWETSPITYHSSRQRSAVAQPLIHTHTHTHTHTCVCSSIHSLPCWQQATNHQWVIAQHFQLCREWKRRGPLRAQVLVEASQPWLLRWYVPRPSVHPNLNTHSLQFWKQTHNHHAWHVTWQSPKCSSKHFKASWTSESASADSS